MSASRSPEEKTERLMNLTMLLLSTRRPLAKAKIRRSVPGYAVTASDEAFDRMFERDKDELRALNIPIVTEPIDPFFDDEDGYRIDQRDYALPDLNFAPDELAVIGLASRAWQHESLATPAATAWQKLTSEDLGTEDPFVALQPRFGGTEPAFAALKDAVLAGRAVTFDYQRSGSTSSTTRRVEPWRLLSWRGRWYLTGYDLDRAAERVYRLSRISSAVTARGRAGAVTPPVDHDPRAAISTAFPDDAATHHAEVQVRMGAGFALRRRALSDPEPAGEGWERIAVEVGDLDAFAGELASYGGDVKALAPPELVEALVSRLSASLRVHEENAR
ncbi:helix-turn-helix transcriptional regulator [Janibacter sp. GXQ6167]|uniref:helix-turn-helix transcriptional regulator n=1 Tax=Janibacter sp. GXQ6167 TaxID=3240791 RepID=UPI0035233E93